MNALKNGQPTLIEVRPTLADGLNVPIAGSNAFHNAKGILMGFDNMLRSYRQDSDGQ